VTPGRGGAGQAIGVGWLAAMGDTRDTPVPVCKGCDTPMEPKKTVTISGAGQRPRMLQVNYRCPECKAKASIERHEYDLFPPEDAVWGDR